MKCHYEILNIAQDADDAAIKTAYRQLALKWHPDKNLQDSDNAKEQFQLVQQAYEILSDRQERAWYDNHREQILRGSNTDFQDNSIDVFQYFTTTCYKGYNDNEQGFYTVYRNIFKQIAKEDFEFMEDKEEFIEIPEFGDSQSDYEFIVAPFYNYWMSYATKKSYVWLDPYDVKETRDRRILKTIEKENKKVRQRAKKERNEEVRNLVAFVRKRDKRVQANCKRLEEKIAENRQKQEKLSKQKRLEMKKLNESGAQAEWTKFDNVKTELEEIERQLVEQFGEEFSNSDDDSEPEILNNLYCVACNKVFKTIKAFENHEFSKRHKENVETLKETMLDEREREELGKFDTEVAAQKNGETEHVSANESNKLGENILDSDSSSNEDLVRVKSKRKNKKPRNVNPTEEKYENFNLEVVTNSDDDTFSTSKKQKKKNKKILNKQNIQIKTDGFQDFNRSITIEKRSIRKNKKDKIQFKEEFSEVDVNHCCATCKTEFISKNKLFDHLKKTGHGVFLPKTVKNNEVRTKSLKKSK